MAGWISSKLKVAETFLQQIDHQAAESLGKNDKPRSDNLNYETPTITSEVVPLKDQLNKKTSVSDDLLGKLSNDRNLNVIKNSGRNLNKEVVTSVNFKRSLNPKPSINDSDWTELLGVPSPPSSPSTKRGNGVSGIRAVRKDGRRVGSSASNLSRLELKRNHRNSNGALRTTPKSDFGVENKASDGGLGGKSNDGRSSGFSDSTRRSSKVELESDGTQSEGTELNQKDKSAKVFVEHKNDAEKGTNGVLGNLGEGGQVHSKDHSMDTVPQFTDEEKLLKIVPVPVTVVGGSDLKIGVNDDPKRLSDISEVNEHNAVPMSIASVKKDSFSASDRGSDSETDSASTSDYESEVEREERKRWIQQMLVEKAAAKAVEAIKERENMVARLEGEKQSLEKILQEQAKQQEQEASKLQTTMIEMMEAADIEKQKHNTTRMEALARLAKLETKNADLTRSLATAQWNLEVEVNRVLELRQQVEKEAIHEELRRKISNTHQTGSELVVSKGVEFEHEILEAEYSLISDKVGQLQGKINALEANIEMTQKEIVNPTEVEIELKKRLDQLTDHLIQKQTQVEALSSEKAGLLFRIEAASRLLDENKSITNGADFPSTSSRADLESGIWEISNSKLRPLFEESIRSGRKHLGSLIWHLDSIFCAGAVFLRKNSTARSWCFIYLISLHLWVVYILLSYSSVSDDTRSGAVISLENINSNGGA